MKKQRPKMLVEILITVIYVSSCDVQLIKKIFFFCCCCRCCCSMKFSLRAFFFFCYQRNESFLCMNDLISCEFFYIFFFCFKQTRCYTQTFFFIFICFHWIKNKEKTKMIIIKYIKKIDMCLQFFFFLRRPTKVNFI